MVKPIIVAVTSWLLTGLVLVQQLHTHGTYTRVYVRASVRESRAPVSPGAHTDDDDDDDDDGSRRARGHTRR